MVSKAVVLGAHYSDTVAFLRAWGACPLHHKGRLQYSATGHRIVLERGGPRLVTEQQHLMWEVGGPLLFSVNTVSNRNYRSWLQDSGPASHQRSGAKARDPQHSRELPAQHAGARLDAVPTTKVPHALVHVPFSNVRSMKKFYEARFVVASVLDDMVSIAEHRHDCRRADSGAGAEHSVITMSRGR